MTRHVTVERQETITTVTLNRPERHNALTQAMVMDLVQAFDDAHRDVNTWAVVLRAEGDASFCSGRDLAQTWASDQTDAHSHDAVPMRGLTRNVFEVIAECSKPVIASIFGNTLAGGAELALACDLRVAADDLSFGFPEVKRGFGANFASVMLPRLIPPGIAKELLYTGRLIEVQEATALGLVNRVVGRADLDATTDALARELLANAPLTIRRHKAVSLTADHLPLAAALRVNPIPDAYGSEDRREGVAAYIEKRKPTWQAK